MAKLDAEGKTECSQALVLLLVKTLFYVAKNAARHKPDKGKEQEKYRKSGAEKPGRTQKEHSIVQKLFTAPCRASVLYSPLDKADFAA